MENTKKLYLVEVRCGAKHYVVATSPSGAWEAVCKFNTAVRPEKPLGNFDEMKTITLIAEFKKHPACGMVLHFEGEDVPKWPD